MVVIEENVEFKTDFDKQKIAEDVAGLILLKEGCPFDCEVDILITDSEEVKEYNKEYRAHLITYNNYRNRHRCYCNDCCKGR